MISVAEIIKILRFEGESVPLAAGKLDMKYFSKVPLVGLGRDPEARIVLVLPAQDDVSGFETEYAEFDPSCKVFIEETDELLPSVSTLRCAIDSQNEEKLQALAAIIKGIAELQEDYGRCGKAIHEMKDFFNNNFRSEIPVSKIVGLIGELLVIAKSADKDFIVGMWHSRADAAFDFSSGNSRVEVKTTRSLNRVHQFSSNQISDGLQATVFIASVSLQVVERGMSFADLVNHILIDLNPNMKVKFMDCVIETIGTVPELVAGIEIDFDSSLENIWLIPSKSIPSPKAREGVLSMEWRASIGENLKSDVSLYEVFLN